MKQRKHFLRQTHSEMLSLVIITACVVIIIIVTIAVCLVLADRRDDEQIAQKWTVQSLPDSRSTNSEFVSCDEPFGSLSRRYVFRYFLSSGAAAESRSQVSDTKVLPEF
jgi:hypothetical protein